MIFSLYSGVGSERNILTLPDTDILCFFHVNDAVFAPADLWYQIVLSSLRLRRSVLILEPSFSHFPQPDTKKRWEVGDGWIWLAPRSMSTLKELHGMNIESLCSFLSKSK